MFRAMFSPIIRSTCLYLQYLVVFTQVTAGWCIGWVKAKFKIIQDTSRQQLGWTLPDTVNTSKCSWWWAKTSPQTCWANWNRASTHPRHQPAATWVNTTRYCKYKQVLLMMGENIARNIWANWNRASAHPRHQPAATWVNTTRYCKYRQVLLMKGENIARNMLS